MAIVQEDRFNAPQPEVVTTEYGAQYVKAATETPIEKPIVLDAQEEEAEQEVETAAGNDAPAAESSEKSPAATEDEKPAKKKGGRPKKDAKK